METWPFPFSKSVQKSGQLVIYFWPAGYRWVNVGTKKWSAGHLFLASGLQMGKCRDEKVVILVKKVANWPFILKSGQKSVQ